MIKIIIFDIGGVLIGYDWTGYLMKEFTEDEKLIKPDHAIYNRIIEKYNLIPSECVFIDDSERNVIGARECGLYAVHAKDRNHKIAVAGLEALLSFSGSTIV